MSGRRQSGRSSHSAKSPSLATISEMEPPEGAPAQRPSERTSEEAPTPEQRQLKRERYQLAGNAFAQQEFARRQMTPPTVIHPAFRPGFNLLDTTQPLPELDPSERLPHAEESPTMRSQFPVNSLETERAATSGQMHRESTQTTLSQFMLNPPEIDLGTTPEHTPVPTQREWLETRDNFELHGGQQPHIPVIKHTPKTTAEEFSSAVSTVSQNDVQAEPRTPGPRSPKKTTFLERVTKWTARRTHMQAQKQKSDADQAPDLPLPPKVRAVLQQPPPARGLGRSPSKTKSFFSRRRSDANELPKPEPARAATSLGHRTPRSVHFETPEPSASQSRHVSGSSTAQRTSNLGRSQSLKYIDNAVPPTPPAKDTPPDEPPIRNMVQQRPAFAYETPIKPREYTSSGRLSPSRIGSNGSRGAAKLVTQPSMFSLRASVVPGAMDQAELDDANSRIGGLGIEGFSMPHETRRGSYTAAYSPSVYSPDDFRRSTALFPERAATISTSQQSGHLLSSLRTPREVDRLEQMRQRGSPHAAQSSDSHMGTISMVYPDLAKDPSIASFMNMDPPPSPSPQPSATDRAFDEVEKMLNTRDQQLTANFNVTPKAGLKGKASTSTRHVSEDSKEGLFAIPVERQSVDETSQPPFSSKAVTHSALNRQQTVASSPMAHHLSAVPSPLRNSDGQTYLPQTTFSPPKPRSRKESHLAATVPQNEEKASSETLLSPYDPPWTPSGRPKPKEDIFKNKPALAASTGDELVVRQSPPVGGMRWSNEAPSTPGDPRKQSTRRKAPPIQSPWKVATTASEPQAPDKPLPEDPDDFHDLDDLIEMITERDSAIQDLQTEMKYENTRLHQRLASLEIKDREKKHGSRKVGSAVQDESKSTRVGKQSARIDDTTAKRVSTSFAHEYYQNQTKTGPTSPAGSVPMSKRSTIILTPNMPQLGAIPDLPRPEEVPREDSPTLPPGSPNPVATPPVKKASESTTPVSPSPAPTDTRYNDLVSLMQQQQAMMLQMMQEIKDLKRSGQGPEN